MGVVLPHGGLDAKQFSTPNLHWKASQFRVAPNASGIEADYVRPRELRSKALAFVGSFTVGSLVVPLVLVGTRDNQVEWRVCLDGVRPAGLPEYLLTIGTANALRQAKQASDGSVEIDGTRYRLHAAHLDGVHVALLIRVES